MGFFRSLGGFMALAVVPLAPSALAGGALGMEGAPLVSRLGRDLSRAKVETVAVVDFTDLSGTPTELGRYIAEELAVALASAELPVTVLDRVHLSTLLKERKRASSGLIEPTVALDAAQAAGAQALVTGTLIPLSESVRVTVKALDARSARLLSASTFEMPRTRVVEELLGRAVPGGPAAANSTPSSTSGLAQDDRQLAPAPPTQRLGPFLVSLESCARQASYVGCSGTVANTGETRTKFAIDRAYAVDRAGNQTSPGEVWIGSGGTTAPLEPQLPVRYRLVFAGLPQSADSVSIVVSVPGYVFGRGYGASVETLTFRGIPLRR